jgi:hypothetical protein
MIAQVKKVLVTDNFFRMIFVHADFKSEPQIFVSRHNCEKGVMGILLQN